MGRQKENLALRFWSKVGVTEGEGCWEWLGSVFPTGYGQFSDGRNKPTIRAHRMAFELAYGPVPEGKYVLHICDNRRCVRPTHLRAGTQSENLQEAHDKGRMVNNRGVNSAKAVLACEQIADIRRRYRPMSRTDGTRAIARELGIDHSVISDAINRKTYQDCAA